MKIFITSSIGASYRENGVRVPCSLDGSNNFIAMLKKHWPKVPKCLIISSEPDDEEMNDSFLKIYQEAFKLTGLRIDKMNMCDRRNESSLAGMLCEYNIVILAGGHVPTQNRFFDRLKLKELLKDYKGIIIGISAGSMNCAETVYAQPEMEGEATDPQYRRYLDGLGLTKISILPHFQEIKELTVDGLRILEDISLPDSKVRPFYALDDGSYIFTDGSKTTLYGEAYLVRDGIITRVCGTDNCIELSEAEI